MRKMKASGIEWIGEIPEGWEIIPVKYLAKYNYDTLAESCSPDFEFSYIDIGSVTYTDGITNYQNFKFKDAPSRARRIVHSGDILVSTVRTYLRAVACVNEHRLPQIASTGFLVLQADISKIHPHFLMYSVLSDNFICKVEANSVGISYPAINASQIVHFKLPIPQLSEQFLLVTYLDRQCSEIDALRSKTLSSIEEYKKLKQAVITQAVTKGVRGEREMKDSGVEWIGEIPAEWSICPLKRLAAIQTGSTPSKTSSESFYSSITGTPWIKPDNLGFSSSIETTAEFLTEEGCSVARTFPSNTVYVGCIGSRIGNCGYSLIPCACNQQINALIFNERMYWKYGWYLTIFQEEQYMLLANGNVIQIINSTTQGNISCIVPSISEQREITAYLDAKCAEIDGLIAKKEQLAKELESYKKSLIYEVVTGKREV